jgi:hypothetical protein
MFFNKSSRRKRGMASNPLLIIPDFILLFSCYGYLRFEKKWENSFGKVGKKVCPVGCLSLAHLKVTIAEFFWKMHRKTWYSILGLDAIPLSLKNLF